MPALYPDETVLLGPIPRSRPDGRREVRIEFPHVPADELLARQSQALASAVVGVGHLGPAVHPVDCRAASVDRHLHELDLPLGVFARRDVLHSAYRAHGMACRTLAYKESLRSRGQPPQLAISTDDSIFDVEEPIAPDRVSACDESLDHVPVLGMDQVPRAGSRGLPRVPHGDRLGLAPTVNATYFRRPVDGSRQVVVIEDTDVREADHLPQLLLGFPGRAFPIGTQRQQDSVDSLGRGKERQRVVGAPRMTIGSQHA